MTDARGPVAGCVFLVGSALLLTALAVTQPLALASLAVVVLGPLHVVLATRYILGRSLPALGGSTGGTLALLVAGWCWCGSSPPSHRPPAATWS